MHHQSAHTNFVSVQNADAAFLIEPAIVQPEPEVLQNFITLKKHHSE